MKRADASGDEMPRRFVEADFCGFEYAGKKGTGWSWRKGQARVWQMPRPYEATKMMKIIRENKKCLNKNFLEFLGGV